jgi:hypothetical protein
MARVARPGAIVALSTPNRLISSGKREKPLNKFHVREYVAEAFHDLLTPAFADVMLYGQSDGAEINASPSRLSALINRIPVRMKYLIPFYLQDMLSVMLRPALKLEDCRFDLNRFDKAHTLYAICRAK